MKKIVFLLFITFSILVADDQDCNLIFKRNEIDPDLKAAKGWKRVCNNDKLENYLTKKVSPGEKAELCMCLTKNVDEAREIYLVRSNSATNPILGGSK